MTPDLLTLSYRPPVEYNIQVGELRGFWVPDIFVSYAHIDNVPYGVRQSNWVTEFAEHLHSRLEQVMGRPVSIWRDPSLRGSAVIPEEIRCQLKKTAIMLAVLSPRYVSSDSCRNEIGCFAEAVNIRLGTRKRIIKVVKTPVSVSDQPELLRDMLGFEFFHVHRETGRPGEFEPDTLEYWKVLNDLAFEIRDLLALDTAANAETVATRIYLAETTSDLADERLQLLRELKDRGFRVLPESVLPLESRRFRAAVKEAISGSKLSIHLVGGFYGVIPEGETSSVVDLQYQTATSQQIPTIVWIPPLVPSSDPRQAGFIARIETGTRDRRRCEILKSRIEELKTFVHQRLVARPAESRQVPAPAAPPYLYLICDSRDRDTVRPVCDCAYQNGFELTLPLESGTPAEIREDHEENLRVCDGVLIYWGKANSIWTRAKMRDLLKAPGLGRVKSGPHAGVFVAAPQTPEKDEFRTQYFQSRNYGPFDCSSLGPFFARLAPAKGRGAP